jgi:hypothetical protein
MAGQSLGKGKMNGSSPLRGTMKYKTYKNWVPNGYSEEPQYPGQQPIRFPEEWTHLECFLGVELECCKAMRQKMRVK